MSDERERLERLWIDHGDEEAGRQLRRLRERHSITRVRVVAQNLGIDGDDAREFEDIAEQARQQFPEATPEAFKESVTRACEAAMEYRHSIIDNLGVSVPMPRPPRWWRVLWTWLVMGLSGRGWSWRTAYRCTAVLQYQREVLDVARRRQEDT